MFSPRKAQIIAILLVLSFVSATPSLTRAQAPAKAPDTGTGKPADDKQKRDYSQEAVVVEQLSMAYRFERDGTGQRDLSLRVKVQSDAGVERFGQLIFGYSSANEKLDMDFVRVRKADGTVVNAATTDIQDLTAPIAREAPIYTDSRQKHITVPGLRPGDVLEYHFVWTIHTPLAKDHFWVEHDFVKKSLIVLDDQLTVNIPAASKVKLKIEPGFDPTIKEQDGRRIYSWKHANLKTASEEEEERKKKEEQEEQEPEEEGEDADEVRPDVQLTTFQSWDEVGKWYADLQKDRVVPDEKIKSKPRRSSKDGRLRETKRRRCMNTSRKTSATSVFHWARAGISHTPPPT